MDQRTFDKGREVRTAVLGEAYVQASMHNADSSPGHCRTWSPSTAGVRYGGATGCH